MSSTSTRRYDDASKLHLVLIWYLKKEPVLVVNIFYSEGK